MRNGFRQLLFLCGIFIIGCLSSFESYGTPKILVVNSYHQGLSWTDSLVSGFRYSIIQIHPTAEFYVEYIDSKRKPLTPERAERYYRYFKEEYSRIDFDLVFLTDDDAVNFWMLYGQDICPDTKVVFAGVNKYYNFPSNYCGLLEVVDFTTSLNLIQRLSPLAEQIYVINDATTTGKVLTKQLIETITYNKNLNKITFLTDLSYAELEERVAAIEPPDVIYFVLYNVDSHGRYLGFEAALDSISRFAKVPIYVPWEFYLSHGALGGNLISPGLHGREAGLMANRIMNGTPIANIGVMPGPTRNFFDYTILKKSSIKLSDLPSGSVVINPPFAFIKQNRLLVITLVFIFILLLFIIFSLVMGNRFKRAKLKREEILIKALSNSQQGLVYSKRKAEEANRLKSSFLANMSHEIRSPMNGIVGFANLLKDVERLSPEKRKTYVDIINANSRSLLSLITDILDISKIEANQMVIYPAPCAVNEMLGELFVFFSNEKARLGSNHLSLSFSQGIPEMDFTIQTDKDRLRQILVNLISNSLKFTPEGSVEWGYTIEDNYLQFYVRDTGLGIDPELHKRIFDRFLQEGHSLGVKSSGVGLGLAICKALVELLGGKIWLNSQIMGGSTFYFTIPKEYQFANDSSVAGSMMPDWSGKQILLVEPDADVASALSTIIKPTLASITVVETPTEAIRNCLPQVHFNVILLNVDGVDFDDAYFNNFVLHCAGKAPMIACGESLDAAAFDFLKKKGFAFWLNYPPEKEQLVAAIGSFII